MGGGAPKAETQAQQQSWTNLNSLFNTANNAATGFGSQGQDILGQVTSYFKNILGSRQGAQSAAAPAANAATAGADASRNQQAQMGTARTGGTVANNQQQQDQTRATIDSLIGQTGPQAASALGNLGQADINAMMNALGLGVSATGTAGSQTTSDINSRRQAAADMWGSLLGGAASLVTAPLGKTDGNSSSILGKIIGV